MPDPVKFVFVSLSGCGHAQSVYADVLQTDGTQWESQILGDLRAGLTVKRVRLEEYREKYAPMLMCGCDALRKELNEKSRTGL